MEQQDQRGADFIVGQGEMADRIRRKDWSRTSLGAIDTWPPSLRTAVSLCLASNFPINIIWGPEHTQIYNDGYRIVCGEVHPRALGEAYDVTWASAWPAVGEPFARALAGETSFLENQRMFLTRNGYLEETFFTFSLSPIRAEEGSVCGLFHPVTETTATMLAERRTRALRDLSGALDAVTPSHGLGPAVMRALQPFEFDLPMLMFYELDEEALCYRLVADRGLSASAQQALAVQPVNADGPWPMREALRTLGLTQVEALPSSLASRPCGPYPEPPTRAVLLPVAVRGSAHPPLLLVAVPSPRLPFDEANRNFLQLLASTVAGLLGSVRALEDERRRAAALAAIDRAKTAFFSNVSHEFRTPLTLLLGPLEDALQEREGLQPQVRERLALAHRNALRLLKLVNSLLDFSRTEAGRAQVAFEPVDLGALTSDIASTFRSATDRAGLALQIATAPLPQPVYVDRGMWETILLNLLSNAFKFTFQGFIRVDVHAAAGGTHVQVAVTDTGTGIPQQELGRLFERFHRVEGAQGRSCEGSGIGLALVQELVKLHGGTIEVSSVEGSGTTFTITLPHGRSHLQPQQVGGAGAGPGTTREAFLEEALRWLPEPAQLPQSAESLDAVEPGVRGGRVLLADDNADMRGYVARLLASQGIEVATAKDGEEALAKAREQVPDLVLSDVMMPRLDGFGLLAAIRADASLRQVPVMLLSARAGQEARVEGLAAGADDYLTKPFSGRELVARVSANLRLNRERRQAADAVAESEARLRTIFQASYLFQGLLTPDGRVLDANATALGAIGEPLSTVAGKPLWDTPWFARTPEMPQAVREMVQAAAAGQTSRREIRLDLPTGGWRDFDFTLRPVHDDAGAVVAIVSESVEITDRKRMEAALREAQKLEAVGRLTGGVAHDFNNLMMVVAGGVSVLERQPDAARQRHALDGMRRAVERGSALTRQLLTFSGGKPLAAQAIDLAAAMRSTQHLLNRTLGGQVRVFIHHAPDLWPVLADPSELERVLLNLGVNARDAMPSGGTVSITAENTRDPRGLIPGDYVRLSVGDTGVGMAPEVRERAFDPFFTTKEIGQGSGVGLAQVYGFAKDSGGTAQIDSAPGQGTTVTLLLPRSPLAPAAPAGQGAAAPSQPLAVSGHGRVLLVEDDTEVAELVAEMLEHLGYKPLRATTAAEALFALEHDSHIDLVFSDVMMPGKLNGVDLARRVRRDHPDIPVILTSGYAESFKQEARNEGVLLLPKPYAMDELGAMVERALQARVH